MSKEWSTSTQHLSWLHCVPDVFPFFLKNELCQVEQRWCFLTVIGRGCERGVCYDEDLSAQRRCALWTFTCNSSWRSAVFASMPQIKDIGQTKKNKTGGKNNCCMNGHLRKGGTDNQTSLFLPLLQVTYCKIDYSTNFPLLCCLYCMW